MQELCMYYQLCNKKMLTILLLLFIYPLCAQSFSTNNPTFFQPKKEVDAIHQESRIIIIVPSYNNEKWYISMVAR